MPTIRLVASAYTRSSTSRVTVTNPSNMYYNTDHTSEYCSIRGRNSSSNTYYCFIHGFNTTDVPANATVTGLSVKIRCYRNSYLSTNSSYAIRLASSPSSSSAISNTTMSDTITTTAGGTTYEIPTGDLTWSQLSDYGSNFSIEIPLRSTANSYPYLYVYGAEIEVTYSTQTISVTGVSLDQHTATIEEEGTVQLTETIAPSNATNKNVTWSTSNSSVATVSGGLVTGISVGSATITVTTADGGFTDTCTVTVTAAQRTNYVLTDTLVVGNTYLVANGNSGSVYLMSNESGGSKQLVGVAATVNNNTISLTAAKEAKCAFECILYTAGNDITTTLQDSNGKYLYSDSTSGLRFETTSSLNRFWHYSGTKFWQFKSTTTDGYTDTSSEYKYYPTVNSSNNFTDAHVSTTSIADTTMPAMYLFTPASSNETLYFKDNGSWTAATKVYKKVNGVWVEQTDLSNVFDENTNYIKAN